MQRTDHMLGCQFNVMESPCEMLLESTDRNLALELGRVAAGEALRIERKLGLHKQSGQGEPPQGKRGVPFETDLELASLLDIAQQRYVLTGGLCDITSGILARVWTFDRSDRVPAVTDVERLLACIGFNKLTWNRPWLTVPQEMELDFGDLGKQYAVDRAYELLSARCAEPFLVNIGGNLRVNRALPRGSWKIGWEQSNFEPEATLIMDVNSGALATVGDEQRFLLKDGVRYSHVLNPLTGWPIHAAPRSVIVAADTCIEAGQLAIFAMLRGAGARSFLEQQGVRHWIMD